METRLGKEPHPEHVDVLQAEIGALWSRIRLANWSIRMFVAGALVICLVIVCCCGLCCLFTFVLSFFRIYFFVEILFLKCSYFVSLQGA